MQWRAWAVVALAAILVLTGLATPIVSTASATSHSPDSPPSPDEDRLGWECGYWHNESVDVDQADGLTDEELDAYVCRAMARVEILRNREFTENVSVSVISRSDYRQRTQNRSVNDSFSAWNNQVWKALFIVGDDADVHDELNAVSGETTAGFYSFQDGEIKIVTETPDQPVIDNATLVHELVHALQDQHYNLSRPEFRRDTQDGQLARDALVEGDANYVERLYVDRCKEDWECVTTPAQPRTDGGTQINFGVFLTVFHPYSDGPSYINALVRRGGWEAVDAAYDDPPISTTQIIHHTDERPIEIDYEHTATNGWEPFPEHGENGSDTAGEASIYAMFWYQAREYGADTIEVRSVIDDTDKFSPYNYNAGVSAGWANDVIVPYRNEGRLQTEYGYVWVTEWDTPEDAEQFRTAYLRILNADAHDARRVMERSWVIDDGPFANSYRVARDGSRVTIIHGPTVEALGAIRPGIDDEPIEDARTQVKTPVPSDQRTVDPNDQTPGTAPTTATPGQTGFGVLAALLALFVTVARRYR